ncbi:DUF5993 family protein [Pusillimonas minor]|uniref:Uncharacterized protein n=1 Tax=Pusillimonas minor TaxID=2697024 RepID=A0A842HNQ1_9BURK|nr:DUF5993 family protein [Pusillimonas minor]MBC2768535.1 hypothetical protein [Pusillimonas minor]
MIMVLPFITLTIAIWLGMAGRRAACIWAWVVSFVIFAAWCNFHITDPLGLSL